MKPFNMISIGMCAATLDDIEGARKAAFNRLGTLQRPIDQQGFGLPEDHPDVTVQQGIYEGFLAQEKLVIKALEKAVKDNPLGPWIIAQKGIGLKQAGRFLGKTSDPYWHNGYFDTGEKDSHGDPVMKPYDRPRTVSELWSYCGYAVVNGEAPRHRKGVQGKWNIAGSCLKAQGHYAEVYYAERERLTDAVHSRDCVRCGPSGKPAPVGSQLSDGHKHARALRIVSKEFLKDIWLESKRLHEEMD